MRGRRRRCRFPRTLTALAALGVVAGAGCTPGAAGRGDDKAGGDADPVVLRLANTSNSPVDGGLDRHPALLYFVDQVRELSQGALRIEVVSGWGDQSPSAEQQVIQDVAAGTIELGWVGTSVFDTVGDVEFQALTAPMLIDSYPLQQAVLDSDIPARMLAGLDELGVHGLAVLGDGVRKPIAVTAPLLRPADYRGITFSAFRSNEHAAAIRALGAIPTDIGVDAGGLRDGTIDGFEKGLRIYEINGYNTLAPYVTANVNLWPHTVALLANPDALSGLTATHRNWLTDAASDAASRSTDLTDDDPEMLLRLCEEGSRFANASAADVAAMRQAFASEYATMNNDPTTGSFIQQIVALKETIDPGPGLDIPSECTGPATATPSPDSDAPAAVVGVATPLDGTYRWTITAADALAQGTPNDKTPQSQATFPWVFTMTMSDGRWALEHRDGEGDFDDGEGTYTVDGDHVTFDWGGNSMTFAFAVDADGTLHLDPQPPISPGDAFVWATNPWTKIAGGTDTTPTVLEGTYRWALATDDVFTITMNDGHWTLRHGGGPGDVEGGGTYAVDGDLVDFDWDGNLLSFAFTVDDDGTLHLVAQPPTPAGDARVWATKPWTKIDDGSDTTPTALDGTYRWTLTKDDALTEGLPGDRTPELLATFPSTYTMTMHAGTWQLASRGPHGDANPDAGHGSYTIDGDYIVFHEAAEQFTYAFSVDDDGSVHLVAQPPISPGPAWIFATNPWTKID